MSYQMKRSQSISDNKILSQKYKRAFNDLYYASSDKWIILSNVFIEPFHN